MRLFSNNSLCILRTPYNSLRLSVLDSITCIIHTNVSARVTSVCIRGVNEVVAFLGCQPTTNQGLATSASESLVFLVVCTSLSMLEYLLISTSLYKLQDNDKCPFLSAVHFLCCKIFEVPLLVSISLSVIQDICKSISLSAVHCTYRKIFTNVLLVSNFVCTLQNPYRCLTTRHSVYSATLL